MLQVWWKSRRLHIDLTLKPRLARLQIEFPSGVGASMFWTGHGISLNARLDNINFSTCMNWLAPRRLQWNVIDFSTCMNSLAPRRLQWNATDFSTCMNSLAPRRLQWNVTDFSTCMNSLAPRSLQWNVIDFSTCMNSLAPKRLQWNVTEVFLQLILVIDGWGISYEIALRWLSLNLTEDKSTLVQVMAWCHQAPSY